MTEESPPDGQSQLTQIFTQPLAMDVTPAWGTTTTAPMAPTAPSTTPTPTPATTRADPAKATQPESVVVAATTPVRAMATHAEQRPPGSQVTTASMTEDAQHEQEGPFTQIDPASANEERAIAMDSAMDSANAMDTATEASTKQVSTPGGNSLINDDDQTLPSTTPRKHVGVDVEESVVAASAADNNQAPSPTYESDKQGQAEVQQKQHTCRPKEEYDQDQDSTTTSKEQMQLSAIDRIHNRCITDMCEWWCAVALHCNLPDLDKVEQYMEQVDNWSALYIGTLPERGRFASRIQTFALWQRFVNMYLNFIKQLNTDKGEREGWTKQPKIWNSLLKKMEKIRHALLEPDANKWILSDQDVDAQESLVRQVQNEDQSDGAAKGGGESADEDDDHSKTQDKVEKEKQRRQKLAQQDCFQSDYNNVKQYIQIQIALAGVVGLICNIDSDEDDEEARASIPEVLENCQNSLKNMFNQRRDDDKALFDPIKHVDIELRPLYLATVDEIEDAESRGVLLGFIENIHKNSDNQYSIGVTIRRVQKLIQEWCQHVLTVPELVQCGYQSVLPIPTGTIDGKTNKRVVLPTSRRGRQSKSQSRYKPQKRSGTITYKDDDDDAEVDSDGVLAIDESSSEDKNDDDVEFEPQEDKETDEDEPLLVDDGEKSRIQARRRKQYQKDQRRNLRRQKRPSSSLRSMSPVHDFRSALARHQEQTKRRRRSSEEQDIRPSRSEHKSGRTIAATPRSVVEDEESASRASDKTFLSGSDESDEDGVHDQTVTLSLSGPSSDSSSDDETRDNPPLPPAPVLTTPASGGNLNVARERRSSENRRQVAAGEEGDATDNGRNHNSRNQRASSKKRSSSSLIFDDSDSESERSLSSNSPMRRRKVPFTDEETEAILNGVYKFGRGKWKEIKEHYGHILLDRTTVQIKDKFRTMLKNNEIDEE